jgi:hypothetical protein
MLMHVYVSPAVLLPVPGHAPQALATQDKSDRECACAPMPSGTRHALDTTASTRHALAAAGLLMPTAPTESTSTLSTSTLQRQRSVLIWQMEGGVGHDKRMMYKPVMDTLVGGFTDLPKKVAAVIGSLRVVPGYVVPGSPNRRRTLRKAVRAHAGPDALMAGDVFIWIGPIGSELVPWADLRMRGVRTVYYQTEPVNGCALAGSSPDEVWDFSWHNIDACRPKRSKVWVKDRQVLRRFVPLGYAAPPVAQRPRRPRPPPMAAPELVFFGYPFYKSGRKRCYERLQAQLGPRLNATWSVWNAAGFVEWWRTSGQWAVQLNLHKTCENPRNPVVFRMALLLSRGAIILSEHANPKDEAE